MQKLFVKTSGDQNFIGALILVVIAVTIGIMYCASMYYIKSIIIEMIESIR